MAAVIYSGQVVKTLKDGLKLGNNAVIYSGSLDPSISGFNANDGDVYISTSVNKIFQKNGGSSTDWDNLLSSASLSTYFDTFNSSSDWGSPSGGYYTITIPQTTHQKGTNPIVQIFELDGSDYVLLNVDQVKISNIGDVSFRVKEIPDLRFEGKILIL